MKSFAENLSLKLNPNLVLTPRWGKMQMQKNTLGDSIDTALDDGRKSYPLKEKWKRIWKHKSDEKRLQNPFN